MNTLDFQLEKFQISKIASYFLHVGNNKSFGKPLHVPVSTPRQTWREPLICSGIFVVSMFLMKALKTFK